MDRKGGNVRELNDVARNTVVLSDAKDLKKATSMLESSGKVRSRTIYDGKGPLGYRGVNYKVITKQGYQAEIQFNTPEMIWAKEKEKDSRAILGDKLWGSVNNKVNPKGTLNSGEGHVYYEKWRDKDTSRIVKTNIEKKSKDYYKLVEKRYYD